MILKYLINTQYNDLNLCSVSPIVEKIEKEKNRKMIFFFFYFVVSDANFYFSNSRFISNLNFIFSLIAVGHARTFWIAYQRTLSAGGLLLLRVEDLVDCYSQCAYFVYP